MKKKQWIEVSITTPAPYQELLVGQLASIGFQGFLQEGDSLSCYAPLARWKNRTNRELETLLHNFGEEFKGRHFSWKSRIIGEKNWNETWEKSIRIVEATSRIIIKPSWRKLRKKDKGKIVLHIDPKMAFGTGHHETTRLSLTLLEEYLHAGDNVLDFGCGTGILAIAAIKLGAKSALAVDNDPWAIENVTESISRNRVNRRVTALEGDGTKLPKHSYDLIIANIDLPTITATLKYLVKRLKNQGLIILSGLLVTDLDNFMNLISHQGIVPLEIVNENEWVAIALTRADAFNNN
ncbi:MAG: 50S ribosomal protein L11 methyltransferase [Ignavibacteriales bacterium]|nr:50S ribosomal protein L11 methyltransferase [Ignavibacteriales bacterium]